MCLFHLLAQLANCPFACQVFDSEGQYLFHFGKRMPMLGKLSDGLSEPSGVCVMGGLVYVTCAGTSKVWVFDGDGNYVKYVPLPAKSELIPSGFAHTLWDARKHILFSELVFTSGTQKP
jgi:hypothetical protein